MNTVKIFFLICFFTLFAPGAGADASREPLALGAIKTYQRLISPSKGRFCPMSPSCSGFAYEVFQGENFFKAVVLSTDRLSRCGNDLKYFAVLETDSGTRFSDAPGGAVKDMDCGFNDKTDKGFDEQAADFMEGPLLCSCGPEMLFDFARSLQESGDYNRALTEYFRLMHHFTGSYEAGRARIAVLECYYESGFFLRAAETGEELLRKDFDEEDKNKILFIIGASYFKTGDYSRSRAYFDAAGSAASRPEEKGMLLTGLSFALQYRWPEAEEVFRRIALDSEYHSGVFPAAELAGKGGNLKLKNPSAAGFMALVPGLGYLYAGHPQTAVSSFAVTGLLAWAAAEAFRSGNDGLGIMLGAAGLSWYGGGMHGSAAAARRYNSHMQESLAFEIRLAAGIDF